MKIQTSNVRVTDRAFTLVELLVVIAIIGVLAGLTLAVVPGVVKKRNLSRIRAEHTAVLTAIENYKSGQGYYPPGNAKNSANAPLVYELKGVKVDSSGMNFSYNDDPPLNTNQLGMYFGVAGIANAVIAGAKREGDPERAPDYFPAMSPKMVEPIAGTPANVRALRLVSGVLGNDGAHVVFNYDVTNSERNNPESFDLWVEYIFKGKTNLVANW